MGNLFQDRSSPNTGTPDLGLYPYARSGVNPDARGKSTRVFVRVCDVVTMRREKVCDATGVVEPFDEFRRVAQ